MNTRGRAAGPSVTAPPAPAESPTSLATQALAVFAVAPAALGGVHVRGRAGPEREIWLQALQTLLGADSPWCKLPVHATDDALEGGLDLAATLSLGKPVWQQGLLARARGGCVVAQMAERLTRPRAARLALALDEDDARRTLIALDEGGEDDEPLPEALRDRMALQVRPEREAPQVDARAVPRARKAWQQVRVDDALVQTLVQAAAALGIDSARAAWQALCVARIAAALRGSETVEGPDAALAAQLVYAHRARQLPPPPEDDSAEAETESPPPPPPEAEGELDQPNPEQPLDDQVVAAAQAAIPAGLLALLSQGRRPASRRGDMGRMGQRAASQQRGRPIGSRPGLPRGGARLALVDTLRAAAPWQRVRRAASPSAESGRVFVQRDDLRVQRRQQKRSTTTIFAIDASGSQAMHRLAEAKGAVELLLADCYARRDRVAVIGFRGAQAQLLLPPTRSLVHAKRQLAGLPGGGGTPLAMGIEASTALAISVRRGGATPLLVVLTDGKANVGRTGEPGRAAAATDAINAAKAFAATGTAALVIDTSPQPGPSAPALAAALQARCIVLPHAGAQAVSQVVRQERGSTGPRGGSHGH